MGLQPSLNRLFYLRDRAQIDDALSYWPPSLPGTPGDVKRHLAQLGRMRRPTRLVAFRFGLIQDVPQVRISWLSLLQGGAVYLEGANWCVGCDG